MRVPLVVRWPGHVQPGVETHQIASLVDLTATAAALTGQELRSGDAPDSFNLLPLLESSGQKPVRDHIIVQQNGSRNLAIRQGKWKFIPDGDRRTNRTSTANKVDSIAGQLFDLEADLAETQDVAAQHPDIVRALSSRLEKVRRDNRTRGA